MVMQDDYEFPEYNPQQQRMPYALPHQYYDTNIQIMTNPVNELLDLEMTLKNGYEDEKGNFVSYGPKLMNDVGIKAVMGLIKTLVARNTHMSSFNDKQIEQMMMFNGEIVIKTLMMNRVKFGISGDKNTTRDLIHAACINCLWTSLNRSLEGGERRFWRGSQMDVRNTIVQEGKKSGGLLSKLNPFSK